uniref:J domain-containing protein n=1 Tax=Parascaris univalens TaxID=6257 RepID=A0A915CJ58_PARUN
MTPKLRCIKRPPPRVTPSSFLRSLKSFNFNALRQIFTI